MDDRIDGQDAEEAEEALSLSDLPLSADEADPNAFHGRRSSSDPAEIFEFFSDFGSQMSHAEDIILGGKLRPLHQPSLSAQNPRPAAGRVHGRAQSFHRRRSESMSELSRSDSSKSTTRLMRNSRSLDYQRLRRTSTSNSETSDIHRSSSTKSGGKPDALGHKLWKPRWYVFLFGLAKFPPEMDLRDIKSRQVRRNPAALFPSSDAAQKAPVGRTDRKSSWGLLRVLSCKDHASVAVTTSFGCMHST